VLAVTLASLLVKAKQFLDGSRWLLLGITAVQLALVLWMLVEAGARVASIRRERAEGVS
jgi:hypothetical protein